MNVPLRCGLAACVLALAAAPGRADVDLPVANGAKIAGTLLPADEVERFRIVVPRGALLSIVAKGKKSKSAPGVPVPNLAVLDEDGRNVAVGAVERSGTTARVRKLPVPATGAYEVQVAGDGRFDGAYQLQVKWQAPKKVVHDIDLGVTDAVEVRVAAEAGTRVKLQVKAARKSAALPRLRTLVGPGLGQAFEQPATGASTHKVSSIDIPQTGEYLLTIDDAAPPGGPATLTIKLRPPKRVTQRIDVSSRRLDAVGFARGALVGAEGGRIEIDPGDFEDLGGAALVVDPRAVRNTTAVLLGSGVAIEAEDVRKLERVAGRGPTLHVGPARTSFELPATLTLPFDSTAFHGDFTGLIVARRDARGRVKLLDADEYVVDIVSETVAFDVAGEGAWRVLQDVPPPVVDFVATAAVEPSNGNPQDRFGVVLDVDAGRLVVGAPLDDEGGLDAGAVYAYEFVGGRWVERQKILSPTPGADDSFGAAVALDGSRLVVGALLDDDHGQDAGAAFLYQRVGGVWEFRRAIAGEDTSAGDRFGAALDLEGDTLVVGASESSAEVALGGVAYVFDVRGDGPSVAVNQQARLGQDAPVPAAGFGRSVAVSADTLIVGASGDESAYVFTRGGGAWPRQARLTASIPAVGAEFGSAVALDGDRAVIAAVRQGLSVSQQGVVYVFERPGAVWSEAERIVALEPAADERFGSSVDVVGDRVLIGAEEAFEGLDRTGAVHVYIPRGTVWVPAQRLLAPVPAASARFGASLAVTGPMLLVGADGSGAFVVFEDAAAE